MHCKTLSVVFGIIAIIFALAIVGNVMEFTLVQVGWIIGIYGVILLVASIWLKK